MIALLVALAASEDVVWMKLEQARAAAVRANKPILVIVTVDPRTGNSVCGKSSGLDKALADPVVEKRSGSFFFVRACDRKTAEGVRATRCMELIFLDPDGSELHRAEFRDAATLEKAMSAATERLGPRPVAWATAEGKADKPRVYVFADERKDSLDLLKALEDRAVAPLHDLVIFVKAAPRSEDAKRLNVSQTPALVVVDNDGKNEVLERLSGRKSAKDIRAALLRALAKSEK